MCLCNQGVAKAKTAIEGTQFGGNPSGDIEVMMNTFYRTASIGFAENGATSQAFREKTVYGGFGMGNQQLPEEDEEDDEEGFEAQEYS